MTGIAKYHFVATCVSSTYEDVSALKESSVGIQNRAFRRTIGAEAYRALEKELGYDHGLRLSRDRHVSYGKGLYRGVHCYFLVWSGIEHIYTLAGAQGPSLAQEAA